MKVKRESAIPLGFFNHHSFDQQPAHIADTIAENLQIGDYLIKYRIRPVIFIRIPDWSDNLTIDNFDPRISGEISFSNHSGVELTKDELNYFFSDINFCRIVLIGDDGYSSFKVKFS